MDNSIKEGFLGQRMIVLPKKIISAIKKKPLISGLYFTDIGFFPKARQHSVRRKNGSKQFILIYCYKGEGVVQTGESETHLPANSYFIIPPDVPHEYYAREENPWSIYWIHFTGPQATYFYDKFALQYNKNAPMLSLEEQRISLFDNLINIMENGYSDNNIEFVNLAIWQLLNAFIYESYFTDQVKKYSENNTVEVAIEYMKEHLGTPLKVDDVAAHFNYSPSHFFTLFKKRTGYSPIHYFNHLKIQKACQYLSFTRMSVKEISFELGFNDPLYFSRLFKKIMNTPPLRYRNDTTTNAIVFAPFK